LAKIFACFNALSIVARFAGAFVLLLMASSFSMIELLDFIENQPTIPYESTT